MIIPSDAPDNRSSGLVVITPAHNEQSTLRELAQSMLDQTVWPDLWVIVNDRSLDNTALVAREIADEVPFAVMISRTAAGDSQRNFAGKVGAFTTGYDEFATDSHHFVACVDADVILPEHYFERVLKEFEARPALGVSGGVYIDPHGQVGRHGGGSVPGPAQVFRHVAFKEIGGFRPLPRGAEDALACTYARQKGWTTEALADLPFRHLRRQGAGAGHSKLRAAYDHGRQDWDAGVDPIFEVVRMLPRISQKPYGMVVLARLAGYARGAMSRTRQVEDGILKFIRSEQRDRLKAPVLKYVRRFR